LLGDGRAAGAGRQPAAEAALAEARS
jgi:hypothetical protein